MFLNGSLGFKSIEGDGAGKVEGVDARDYGAALTLDADASEFISFTGAEANMPVTPGTMTALLTVGLAITRGANLGPELAEVTTNVTATMPGPTVTSDGPPGPRIGDGA